MSGPTLRHAMIGAVQALRATGLPDPQADVRRLMAYVLGVDAGRLTLMAGDRMTAQQWADFDACVTRRSRHQPVAQITGTRAFWKHDFRVTPATLDPRPETETLVTAALDLPWRSLLDLGTGTGAILISLLAERPGTTGLGVDLSTAALEVARGNAARIGVTADFAPSDWFSAVTGCFDLIVSNPPYIAAAEMPGLSPEVRDWEPHLALTDGADGLGAYRAIAAGAAAHLTPGGAVLVEIGPTQGAAVSALFADAGAGARVLADLDGRDRVVLAQFPA
ncbi:MAG: peptide chain release factor N(5)-glutamine methyltransferase [Paracoccus sp. (in: a-proteobacteria)]|uniref:peptide chain release factor N(5)-glutamine methyltransferase n=1 Tax=Paracoccus sp. TaxID=267 RepID=UPI0026E078D6|nr:peptide chain release factor N(5)-glutamine methyltransferase [Paracoccus sp. (in: a-proteobacteria)]MDO5633119.1 peptide chain release factor N(5)-glutamine methyltransferase [Paracoccus sp. (in: a-proteobacteria)]